MIFIRSFPRDFIVIYTDWHSIVSKGQDLMLRRNDAGSDLGMRIFAAQRRKESNRPEILMPRNVVKFFQFGDLLSSNIIKFLFVIEKEKGCLSFSKAVKTVLCFLIGSNS